MTMNEQAYQREMDDQAQFEAEQEALREEACAKYEDYKPLLDEMIKHSLDIGQIDMYELLIDSKEKLEKLGVLNAEKICNFPCLILEDFFQP